MPTISVQLHPSMRIDGKPHQFEGEFEDGTIIQAIHNLLSSYPDIYNLCLKDGAKKPGILYISNKVELSSLGVLDQKITEDLHIRMVPVLHGG